MVRVSYVHLRLRLEEKTWKLEALRTLSTQASYKEQLR
jgi:hypothetical protein